jgi:hypothetical protein
LDASLLFYSRRHGGSCSQEVDMGVIGKRCDQGEEQGCKNRNPALPVKTQSHRSEPKPSVQENYWGIRGITGQVDGWIQGLDLRPELLRRD